MRAGAFEGLRNAVRDLGADRDHRDGRRLRAPRPGRRRLPDRREVARRGLAEPAGQRYVVANGYGADPGVQTDATLLRADPWRVLEGLAIAAFATGATEAILAVRADDPALVTRLEGAALAAEEAGFLGDERARQPATGSTSRSGPSRARTCWARRRSC